MKNKLTVANIEQKIILMCEMQGQISDGYWENTRPDHHWKEWCNLDWDNVAIGDNIGVEGNLRFQPKRNYQFHNKTLLDVVGDRIILKINVYRQLGGLPPHILNNVPDGPTIPDYPGEYWDKVRAQLQSVGITEEVLRNAMANGTYTKKDLINDCKGLQKAFKTDRVEGLKDFPTLKNGNLLSINGDIFTLTHITSSTTAILMDEKTRHEEEVVFKKVGENILIMDPYSLKHHTETRNQFVNDFKVFKTDSVDTEKLINPEKLTDPEEIIDMLKLDMSDSFEQLMKGQEFQNDPIAAIRSHAKIMLAKLKILQSLVEK